MDLKHDLLFRSSGGGLSLLSDDLIKSEPHGDVPSGSGNGLFCNITSSQPTKRQRTDDWLSSPSPGSLSIQSQTPAPAPLTPSPGPPSHSYVISNGYSSPTMSSGSYDPYSPNGKIGESRDK